MLSIRALRFLASDHRGVSAIEFAIGAPVMILLLLAGVDSARYALAVRRIEQVTTTIGQMVSVNTLGTVDPTDIQFYESSAFAVFPLVLSDSTTRGVLWNTDLALTVSSVKLSTSGSTKTANVSWSTGSALRSCTKAPTMVSDTAPPSPTTLPTDAFGTGSIIVVDASFTFRPTIASPYLPTIAIIRSFYVQPRFVTSITLSGGTNTTTNQC